jgi:GT2 family glycosyltransferase
MKLSVIIVNYNVQYFLEQCLESVKKAITDIDAEVFVVDNNSKDGSVAMVAEKFPEVHLIANTDNPGFSKANNQAIKISKGEYVLLLNPDTVVGEDTFKKCIDYMDADPTRGGLGIKMIDGKGEFLAESKRGLPTPTVAFYKIFGLSSVFKNSKKFGKYHLSYLSKEENHDIEVLSGAYMFMRKATLDKCGLLDETFFMYGEDIDLSYRITLSGYKNVYFSDSEIIHYKGESTKKGSINYVFVFYKAMIIFAKKHFHKNNAFFFQWAIYFAIYLRAFLALVKRFFQNFSWPILDVLAFGLSFMFVTNYWERNHLYVTEYPDFLYQWMLPGYILFWVSGLFLSGGYRKSKPLLKSLRGMLIGTITILLIYSLLPEFLRTSRALVLLGSMAGGLWVFLSRTILQITRKHKSLDAYSQVNTLVLSSDEVKEDIQQKLQTSKKENSVYFHLNSADGINWDTYLAIHRIGEVVFSDSIFTNTEIIQLMDSLAHRNLEFKIALKDKEFIIGSNSIHQKGQVMKENNYRLSDEKVLRSKRMFDVFTALLLFILSPLLFLFQEEPTEFLKNIFYVLFGEFHWVGYNRSEDMANLPKIKDSVLSAGDKISTSLKENEKITVNTLYAKSYEVEQDVQIILKNWRKLGNKTAQY